MRKLDASDKVFLVWLAVYIPFAIWLIVRG